MGRAGAAVGASGAIPGWVPFPQPRAGYVIGALPGEGVGPEVVGAALAVLDAVAEGSGVSFAVRRGGPIGVAALRETGAELPPAAASFCEGVFADGGAVLCGPGGGRFVYDLRARFDLFCKLVPIRPLPALADAMIVAEGRARDADVLIVRENVGGLYAGPFGRRAGGRVAFQECAYDAAQVARVVTAAAALAERRRGASR